MAEGTRSNGINCIVVNSEVEEVNIETNEKLDALIEVNLSTEDIKRKLNGIYRGWDILNLIVKPLEYKIIRNELSILLKTNAVTYVVRKHV